MYHEGDHSMRFIRFSDRSVNSFFLQTQVSYSCLVVDNEIISQISKGLMVLVGIGSGLMFSLRYGWILTLLFF